MVSAENGHILGRPRGVMTLADAIDGARRAERTTPQVGRAQSITRQGNLDKAFDGLVGHDALSMLRNAGYSRCQGRPAPRIRLNRGRGLRMEISYLHAIHAGVTVVPACWVVMAWVGRWIMRECSDAWLRHHVFVLAGIVEDEMRRIQSIEEGA